MANLAGLEGALLSPTTAVNVFVEKRGKGSVVPVRGEEKNAHIVCVGTCTIVSGSFVSCIYAPCLLKAAQAK